MTTNRSRLSRRAAARMLDHRGDPNEPLARLLEAAAAAPAAPAAGEERASALFREAPVAGSTPMNRLTRRIAALPIAALAAGSLALGGGGLALAASQGALHVPFTGHDNRSSEAPEAPASTNPGLTRTPGSGTPATPSADASHLPSATPSPSLDGLCRAYQAGAVPRKATNPAFAALTRAAGSAEAVSAFCSDRVGTPSRPPRPTTPPKPSQATTPTTPTKPTQAAHPTRPPKPTQAAR